MKILLFILIAFIVSTCCYILGELLRKWFDPVIDKWLYNKGICRHCKNKYKYITSHEGYTLFECPNCHNLIVIKSDKSYIKT